MTGNRYFLCVTLCSLLGAVASALALQHHYRRDPSSFCSFNATFDCDVVNRSSYSTIAGVPVALIGVGAYLLLLGLTAFQRENSETPMLVFLLSFAGLVFSLYLTYVEAEILRTWYVLCLTSLLSIGLIVLSSGLRIRADLRGASR